MSGMDEVVAGMVFLDYYPQGYGITIIVSTDNGLSPMWFVSHRQPNPSERYCVVATSLSEEELKVSVLEQTYGKYIGTLNGRNVEDLLMEKLKNGTP